MEETAHCFMPDHAHLLVEGRSETADALKFVHRAKQLSAYAFSQALGQKLWQPSFFDRFSEMMKALSVSRGTFSRTPYAPVS
jgi:REP element-mobilizing transposase RayT